MWWRIPVGVLINCVMWIALCTIMITPVRVLWPDYASAEPVRNFTLAMMVMRLSISAIASLMGGWLAGFTVRENRVVPLAGGLLMLAMFIPVHLGIWAEYPVWYHVTYLTSLPVLAWIGGRLAPTAS
jgi:hypothetical protein